jgi:hypothetical protein
MDKNMKEPGRVRSWWKRLNTTPCWRGCGARMEMGAEQIEHEKVCPLGARAWVAQQRRTP